MIESAPRQLPRWVQPVSQVIIALQWLGIAFFSFYVLSTPGRRSGRMRTTVVSPFTVDGDRYLLSFGELSWVRNARAAGWARLSRGRKATRVALVEIPAPDSAAIAREFPNQIPAGVQFFVRMGLVEPPGRSDQFEAAAGKLTVFRIDPSTSSS